MSETTNREEKLAWKETLWYHQTKSNKKKEVRFSSDINSEKPAGLRKTASDMDLKEERNFSRSKQKNFQ